ncbi:MAG: hypothetical protein LC808_02540 [Actinobacteria bacterium]|nr:hypothetical protein [Actinomycetota bacterium]
MPKGRSSRLACVPIVALSLLGPVAQRDTDVVTLEPESATTPLVFAYYYIWYSPASWARAKVDVPSLGPYDSDDAAVIHQHVAWARQAGIDGLLVSWKHVSRLDAPLATLVGEARAHGLKLILLYEGLDFHRAPISPSQVGDDLAWFVATYGTDPVFDVFGAPAVVWSGSWKFTDREIAAVRDQVGAPERVLLLGSEKDAGSYAARSTLLDGDAYYWSSANPRQTPGYDARLRSLAKAVHGDDGAWIAPAAPGFDARLVGGTSVVPRDEGATYRASWDGALATSPDVLGIISWNEFSENSHIEPSEQHGTLYLELTAQLVSELPGHVPIDAPSFTADPRSSSPPTLAATPAAPTDAPTADGPRATSGPSRERDTYLSLLAGLGLLAALIWLGTSWRSRGAR